MSPLWSLRKLFSSSQRQIRRRNRRSSRRLRAERLEDRTLLSANAAEVFQLSSGMVVIDGSDAADEVVVVRDADSVLVASSSEGSDGVQQQVFDADSVSLIVFVGRGGNDLFWNGTDLPSLAFGGSGTDLLVGGTGADSLVGESGNDILLGNSGNDVLWGEGDNDQLDGGAGNDDLYGGTGDDVLVGLSGNDTLWGEAGNDVLSGDAGDDVLRGGDGNDALGGGAGNDVIRGENGHDVIFGGSGQDAADGGLGDDVITGGFGHDELYGEDGHDIIFGDSGNDQLDGGTGDDLLLGNAGNDTIVGGAGDDRAFGHEGIDWIYGDAGNDQLFGGNDTDVIFAGDGMDVLDGGAAYDYLFGEAGTDLALDSGANYVDSAFWFSGGATVTLTANQMASNAGANLLPAAALDAVFAQREALFDQLDQPLLPVTSSLPLGSGPIAVDFATSSQLASSFGGTFAATSTLSSSTPIGTGNIFGGPKFYRDSVAEGLVLAGPQNGALVGQFFADPRIAALSAGALTGVQANQVLEPYLGMSQQQFLQGFTANVPILSGLIGAVPGLTLPF